MATYSIKAVKYCSQTVPKAQVFWMSGWDEWMDLDFYFFILRRDDDGKVLLIDTGVRDLDEIQPTIIAGAGHKGRFRMDMATQNVPLLLQKEGIDPADVETVLLSHFHYDHASNVKLFPNAKYVASRTGWHLTLDPPYPYMITHPLFPRDVLAYLAGEARDRLVLVDDEAPEIVPGIGAFYVGGHTMCCQAFTVQTKDGLAVFPSDTVFTYENLEKNHPVGLTLNVVQCYDVMERARQIADIVVPPHDPELLRRYPDGVVVA